VLGLGEAGEPEVSLAVEWPLEELCWELRWDGEVTSWLGDERWTVSSGGSRTLIRERVFRGLSNGSAGYLDCMVVRFGLTKLGRQ